MKTMVWVFKPVAQEERHPQAVRPPLLLERWGFVSVHRRKTSKILLQFSASFLSKRLRYKTKLDFLPSSPRWVVSSVCKERGADGEKSRPCDCPQKLCRGREQRPLPSPRSLMSCFYQKLGFFGFFSLGDVRKGRWTDKKCRHPPQDTDGFLMLPRVVTWAPPASLLVCKHLLLLWSHGAVQMKSSLKIRLKEFWEEQNNPAQLCLLPKPSLSGLLGGLPAPTPNTQPAAPGAKLERGRDTGASFADRNKHLSSRFIFAEQKWYFWCKFQAAVTLYFSRGNHTIS